MASPTNPSYAPDPSLEQLPLRLGTHDPIAPAPTRCWVNGGETTVLQATRSSASWLLWPPVSVSRRQDSPDRTRSGHDKLVSGIRESGAQ
jgi:hypothetical protein